MEQALATLKAQQGVADKGVCQTRKVIMILAFTVSPWVCRCLMRIQFGAHKTWQFKPKDSKSNHDTAVDAVIQGNDSWSQWDDGME